MILNGLEKIFLFITNQFKVQVSKFKTLILMSFFQTLTNEMHKLKEIRLNRNIISYLICVIIASILWFLNALNKDYSAELSFSGKIHQFSGREISCSKTSIANATGSQSQRFCFVRLPDKNILFTHHI